MSRLLHRGALLVGLGCFSLGAGGAFAQLQVPGVQGAGTEQDLPSAVSHLAARAGFVFVATVERIERGASVVEVTLRVEQVLRGQPGSQYLLREWAGRWPLGTQRYTVGQRALFFLQTPSASGLSSPVDGADGVVPVFGDPVTGAALDVRRLTTRLNRQIGDKLSDARTMPLAEAASVITTWGAGQSRPANPSGVQPVAIVVRGTVNAQSVEASHGAR